MKNTLSAIFLLSLVLLVFLFLAEPIFQFSSAEKRSINGSSAKTFDLKAAERGNPWINLQGGESFAANFNGSPEDVKSLTQTFVNALSLEAADFDEDGMPDLIAGYGAESRGVIAIYQGNADVLYPNSFEAKKRKSSGNFIKTPFFPTARLISAPEQADYLGAGDFDADGQFDFVRISGR